MKFVIILVIYTAFCSSATVPKKYRPYNLFQTETFFNDIFGGCMVKCLEEKEQHNYNFPSRPQAYLGFNIKHCGNVLLSPKNDYDTCMK